MIVAFSNFVDVDLVSQDPELLGAVWLRDPLRLKMERLWASVRVPGAGFEPAASGPKALQIMSFVPKPGWRSTS